MLRFLKKLFGLLSLEEVLHETKQVKINGVLFTIKKINSLDYLNGSKVMIAVFDTYKKDLGNNIDESSLKKVKEHYKDVIMAGVIKPKLTRKDEEGTLISVNEVLDDWDLATKLYSKIIEFTYGKKKLFHSQKVN